VKELGEPVLPPRRISSGCASSVPTASAVKVAMEYSSPMRRRYHLRGG
jgi:hypothetical protein